jgi:hypothetical protein
MKTARVAIALAAETALFCWCGAAQAYRPFDGTDAAVAETGEVEIELGPVEYLRDEADRALLASNVRTRCRSVSHPFRAVRGDLAGAR